MTRTAKRLFCILLSVFLLIAALPITVSVSAAGTVIEVSTAQELSDACSTINSNGGEYTISLQEDITGSVTVNKETAVVTLVGNGHTLTQPRTVVDVLKGTLNLGDGNSALTLKSDGTLGEDPGIIHVWYENAVCNMYDKVTVTGRKSDNYFGGGATVERGTFHMYGGTITNCGVYSGSTCFGGGVASIYGGTFIMDGGKITECTASTPYTPDHPAYAVGMGGGVLVSSGSTFIMNGGEISNNSASSYGGGVAVVVSNAELRNYGWGKLYSHVEINGGKITGNEAILGAGVFASGYYSCNANAMLTPTPDAGAQQIPGLFVNGGEISANHALQEGGGILAVYI